MAGILHQFDRRLYEQKLLEPSLRMGEEVSRRWQQVRSEVRRRGNVAGLYPGLIDAYFEVLREHLKEIDQICRDVWRVQGKIESPHFIREVIRDYAVFGAIAAHCAALRGKIELEALRTNAANFTPALHHLQREKGHLENIVSNRYEVEAREFEYTMRRTAETARAPVPIPQSGPTGGFDVEQESLRALIEDAERDTVLWLQANPSAQERLYVYGMQAKLGELSGIITRRIGGGVSPDESGRLPEIVDEVLSFLRKATEVRGNIVGTGLARLAERLTQELAGPKVRLTQQHAKPEAKGSEADGTKPSNRPRVTVPPPVKPVGGWSITLPKASQVPHDPPTYFPGDLWPQTNVILLKAQRKFPLQTQTLELCKHVISEMTPFFCEAVEAGAMRADQVLFDSGMGGLLHSLLVYNCDHEADRFGVGQEARKSDEWLKLAQEIADLTQKQSAEKPGTLQAPTQVTEIYEVDRNLRKLGLVDFSFGQLAKHSDKHLLRLLGQWEEQLRRLREANPDWQPASAGTQTEADHLMMRTYAAVRQLKSALALRKVSPAAPEPQSNPKGTADFGKNIRRLRKELGWSANKLAEESGLDRKQVLSHEKGTQPHPKNKALYAETFTRGFTKKNGEPTKITVQDLEK